MKFNTPTTRPLVRSPILTNGMLAPTFEGGTGYVRDAKSELFMTAIATMAGEDTFYESGKDRLDRITALVQQVVKEDPAWLQEFLPWLRGPEGNLRSVSISMAVEYAKAGGPNARSVVSSVLQRADEPGEAIAYVHSRYGRKLAGGLQRGIADAASRLFNEYSAQKYDGQGANAVRLGDVIELTHPKALGPSVLSVLRENGVRVSDVIDGVNEARESAGLAPLTDEEREEFLTTPNPAWSEDLGRAAAVLGDVLPDLHARTQDRSRQHALFQYLLDRRHHSTALRVDLAAIPQINEARRLEATPVEERRALLESDPGVLQRAGKTWEWLSGWLPGGMDKQAWEAILGEDTQGLGYMALIRNLRNFSQAGISDAFVAKITQRIQDPAEVAKSRQFPFRFLSAYENSPIEYAPALEKALTLSTQNIPDLSGSLILIDTSSSMRQFYSGRGSRSPLDIAAVMAMATLARSKDSDVVIFGDGSEQVDLKPTLGVLRGIEKVSGMVGRVGHSTYGWTAAKMHYNPVKHKRVIIFTDGQMHDSDPGVNVIGNVLLCTIGGYKVSASSVGSNGRWEIGGFTDATFKMVDLLERGRDCRWPWLA
jgi:hypothetical protein